MSVVKKSRCPECAKLGKDRSGDNLISYSDGHSYCYGCGYTVRGSGYKLNNYVGTNKQQAPVVKVSLPADCDFSYPKQALEWMGGYELDRNVMLRSRVMWSPSHEWLCFPIFDKDEGLLGYAARNFSASRPKPKWLTYGDLKNIFHLQGDPNKPLVIVEDIVSAIKLSQVTQSMPIFGTHIGNERWKRLYKLVPQALECVIWLDPDMRVKAIKESSLGASMGLNTRVIISSKDPKEHSFNEIKEILNDIN